MPLGILFKVNYYIGKNLFTILIKKKEAENMKNEIVLFENQNIKL